MTSRKKTFDCVEMKNRIQEDLRQEYEARKAPFASYVDFLNTTANESEEIRTFLEKVANARTAAKS
jgi:hypothetical protein